MRRYIFFAIVFLLFGKIVSADIEITEIMYAPPAGSSYEWVEVFNNGSQSIDLNKYRFFHGQANSSPMSLKVGQGTILKPLEYIIITKSLPDYNWLNTAGTVYSATTLSLPDKLGNTYIAISDSEKNIIDSITYNPSLGGSKDSKTSLSKINGIWQSGVPTPGQENKKSVMTVSVTQKSSTSDSTSNISSKNIPTKNSNEVITENYDLSESKKSNEIINLNNLKSNDTNYGMYIGKFSWLGLVVVIILGIVGIFSIKNKKEIKDYREEGNISVDDIKIIE